MKETRDEFHQRVHAQGLDHLVGRIVLNADTKYAAQEFLQACQQGALAEKGATVADDFLDRMLPKLDAMEWLPADLVPMMIRHFKWPDTAEGIAAATGLRADVRELLERHVAESRLVHADAPVVPAPVDRRMLYGQLALVGLLVFLVLCKVLLKVVLHH
jgi:hypothetical protein